MAILDAPIFLFCSERSGSNLICKILDAHPDICAPGASHLFRVMSECAHLYVSGSEELRNAVLKLFRAKVSRWKIDALPLEDLANLLSGLDNVGEMAASLYHAESKAAGKSHVMLKENSAFAYLPMLIKQSSSPRVLFMVRDPRDMAVSWMNGPVMRGGVLRAVERWVYDQNGYLAALPQLPYGSLVSFLRYEDLLDEPETELRRVCGELGLNFSTQILDFANHSSSAKIDAKMSSMWSNLNKGLIRDNKQKFITSLNDDAIAYIEVVTGSLLSAMGYSRVRNEQPEFGQFETLEALRLHLSSVEPYDKQAYRELPTEERAQFEAWSQLRQEMSTRPPLPPELILGHDAK